MRFIAGAVFLLGGSAALAADRSCETVRQPHSASAVLKMENRWVRAIESRDARNLACILAPGFADVTWRGEVRSRAQVLRSLPQGTKFDIHLSGMSVMLDGDTAVVRGTNALSGANAGTLGAVRFTDVFLYRGGRWRAIAAQETPQR